MRRRGTLTECLRCEHPAAYWRGERPGHLGPEVRRLQARGLCAACYQQVRFTGDLSEYPERMTPQEVAEEVEVLLRSRGPAEVVEALDVSAANLARTLYRAGRPDLGRPFGNIVAAERRAARRAARRESVDA